MTTETACPKCQSRNVHYLHLSKLWECPKCGPIVPEETEAPDAPLAPCRVCSSDSVYRHPTMGLVCRQCGSNQKRSPKHRGYEW